jgi:sugar/nucleoside kinase (ribokinase family)
MTQLPKANAKKDRIVIITQETEPTIVAYKGEVNEYPVLLVPPEEIVDTNSAGDAFVGGFLALYIKGKPIAVSEPVCHFLLNLEKSREMTRPKTHSSLAPHLAVSGLCQGWPVCRSCYHQRVGLCFP